jgi:hypothetical protein
VAFKTKRHLAFRPWDVRVSSRGITDGHTAALHYRGVAGLPRIAVDIESRRQRWGLRMNKLIHYPRTVSWVSFCSALGILWTVHPW